MAMVPFLVLVLCLLLPGDVRSQNPGSSPDPMAGFQPTLAFVIAMLSVMFSITFVLLLYAKLCHRPSRVRRGGNQLHDGGFLRSWRRSSGVDKSVVESLPFFRFEALKGAKGGLECPVCLAKYEDEEILRLLPKCKHAFHVECIDSWLEKHSSCPLCRRRVTADDLLLAPSSRSFQFQSEDSDLYVRREESLDWSSRSGMEDTKEDAALCLAVGPDEGGDGNNLHKFNHEIVVAQPPINGRWSSMSSPDLILLISEMMTDVSSARVESGNGESIFDIRRKRQISEINHPPPFRCPTTAAGSSHSTTDQRSLSDISPYLRVSDTNGQRTSSFGAAGRRTLPLQIETTPVVEPVAGTSTSTSEEPNPRVVNV